MDVMVLKRPLKGVQTLFTHADGEMTHEQQDYEIAAILGEDLGGESRDREIRAFTDHIKMLEAELQKARTEAYQAGYEEGQRLAKAEAGKQSSQLVSEFSENVIALHTEFQDTLVQLSVPVLKLALGVSEKLIHRELSLDENSNEILRNQVQHVLNETATQTQAVVQVNANQMDWITGKDVLRSLNIPPQNNLRFIPNPELKPGECKLETEDYLVDSTIKSQLENLEKILRESHAAGLR